MSHFLMRGWTAAVLACAALPLAALPAFAHVTLQPSEATSGTMLKAMLRVPHGCNGAATTALRVTIPEGVLAVKPQPKAGWTIGIETGRYSHPYDVMHGPPVAEGVKTLTWSGNELSDSQYDEFTFVAFLAPQASPTTLYFPTLQTCGTASVDWSQIPAAGAAAPARPAPALKVAAATQPAGMVKVGSLVIEQPWSRATPGGANVAGGYVKITNTGSAPDQLVSASLTGSGHGEIHEMAVKDGVMSMRPLKDGLTIPAGGSVVLAPGGYHLMFMDLTQPLKEGESVKGRLVFEKAGPVEVTFQIRGIGASMPAAGGMEHMH